MTVKELLQEVKSLGFAEYARLDDSFVCAANRALRALLTERPTRKSTTVFAPKCKPLTETATLTHEAGIDLCLTLTGRAISMRLYGKGRYTLTDDLGVRSQDFDARGERFSDFISGECEICFSGEYTYSIYSLSTFDTLFGSRRIDIPDGSGKVRLDMNEILHDFLCFTSPVRDKSGNIIEDAELCGSTLTLPVGFVGEVEIVYARAPRKISLLDPSEDVDIPASYSHALPLLIAYYMLLPEDEDKAAEYLRRYKESLSAVDKIRYEGAKSDYTDTHGWA